MQGTQVGLQGVGWGKQGLPPPLLPTPTSWQASEHRCVCAGQVKDLASVSLKNPVRIFVNSNTDVAPFLRQEFIRIRPNREGDREAIVAGESPGRDWAGGAGLRCLLGWHTEASGCCLAPPLMGSPDPLCGPALSVLCLGHGSFLPVFRHLTSLPLSSPP